MPYKPKYKALQRVDAVPEHPPSRFQVGDQVRDIEFGDLGRVDFVRKDLMINVIWSHSGKREWLHESNLIGASEA